jgi:hypothetical protein
VDEEVGHNGHELAKVALSELLASRLLNHGYHLT